MYSTVTHEDITDLDKFFKDFPDLKPGPEDIDDISEWELEVETSGTWIPYTAATHWQPAEGGYHEDVEVIIDPTLEMSEFRKVYQSLATTMLQRRNAFKQANWDEYQNEDHEIVEKVNAMENVAEYLRRKARSLENRCIVDYLTEDAYEALSKEIDEHSED